MSEGAEWSCWRNVGKVVGQMWARLMIENVVIKMLKRMLLGL